MSWILITLIAPALWAIVNYIDEYLLKELEFKPLTLSVFSGVAGSLLLLGFVFLFKFSALVTPSFVEMALLIFAGITVYLFISFNLFALDDGEASVVSPLFLFSVIFSYILGIIFLGELIETQRLVGVLCIMIGSFIIAAEPGQKIFGKVRGKIMILMIAGSFFAALDATIFRYVVEPKGDMFFWTAVFWQHVGLLIASLFAMLYIWIANINTQPNDSSLGWKDMFRKGRVVALANVTNESLATIGNVALGFALILSPAALVLTVAEGFQPLFVIVYGFILSKMYPKIFASNGERLFAKGIAAVIMCAGVALVLL